MTRELSMWNPFADMATLPGHEVSIVRGSGSTVWDADGKAYLDAIASLWYCNVGHGREELADVAAAQMRELASYQTFELFTNPPAEALAERLAALVPMPSAKVLFTPGGGSDAIDTAGKLARAYWAAVGQPERRVVIGRKLAYHGMNAYGTSLGGIDANVALYRPLVGDVEHVAWDEPEALSAAIDRVGTDRVAAFFCEPVMGAGGVLHPPVGYLAEVRAICRERDVLFVADEVICGFGRLGEWFGSGRFGLDPDMMTVAKGLTSGYLPLGAVIVGPRVAEPFWRRAEGAPVVAFRSGYTYGGHPTACAVALANLDILEREHLVERVQELEPVLDAALKPIADHPLVAEVRSGLGLLAAVELEPAAIERRPTLVPDVMRALRERGVISRALVGKSLQISPPFVITQEEIGQLASAVGEALDAMQASA